MSVQCQQEQEKGVKCHGSEVTDKVVVSCHVLGIKLGSLEEQPLFLTTVGLSVYLVRDLNLGLVLTKQDFIHPVISPAMVTVNF